MEVNKDLLLCENKYFLEKNKLDNILNFNKESQDKPKQLKTEKISSNVLSNVRSFLDKVKNNDSSCVNIEQDDDDDDAEDEENTENEAVCKKKIQLDLLLFEQNEDDTSSDDSSDDDS